MPLGLYTYVYIYYCMGWSVIWWDIARVGFCISRANGEWNTAHKCNVSPYYTPPHAMINLLYTNTKRDGYNSSNPGRSSYDGGCMIIAIKPCRFTSVIGNMTIAELESTPKDSDFVGGASSPCTWPPRKHNASSACSAWRARLWEPSFSEPPYTQPLTTKNTACKTSSRTAIAKQTGSFLAVSMHVSKRPLLRMRSS